MREKTLVIGAAGHVCLETVRILSERGNHVRIGCRCPEKAKALDLHDVELFEFDYFHPETYKPLFEGIDNWLLVSPPRHMKLHDVVDEVVDYAAEAGINYIVNISEFHTFDENHPMQIIENRIEISGMNYSILRANCFMQFFNSYFRESIKDKHVLNIPAGDARTSFIDMRDVAEIAANLLTVEKVENKTFVLTGKEALSVAEVAELFSDELHEKIEYHNVEDDEFKKGLENDGWFKPAIDTSMAFCEFVREGWNEIISDDVNYLLGRDPLLFRQFIKDHIELWQEPVL